MPAPGTSPSIRLTIRKRYEKGASPTQLAKQFRISRSTVHAITKDLPSSAE